MRQVLYRKYRSMSLSEIVGQEHITSTLSKAIQSNRISHAYLFTGPRGVGKTSIARILAHEINNFTYSPKYNYVDIIEIDAASNRRIDEIRDLRDNAHILPALGKYKVYIIDEVHMLTKEAFNALLKTLEEPPEHVIFILATTDINKIPDTIISRTQRFSFREIPQQKLVDQLHKIAKLEKIEISDKALQLIAKHGEGSFRDSISFLDQLSSYSDQIKEQDVLDLLGLPSEDKISHLIQLIENSETNAKILIDYLDELYQSGYEAPIIAHELMVQIRNNFIQIDNISPSKHNNLIQLLDNLLNVEASLSPKDYLTLILLKQLDSLNQDHANNPSSTINKSAKVETNKNAIIQQKVEHIEITDNQIWQKLLDKLKTNNNTLYGIIKMAHPSFESNYKLILKFNFAFHQKRVNESKNKEILHKILNQITNQDYRIQCELDTSLMTPTQPLDKDLSEIKTIFGAATPIEID